MGTVGAPVELAGEHGMTRTVGDVHVQEVCRIENIGTYNVVSVWDRCYAVRDIKIAIDEGIQLDKRLAAFRGHRNLDWGRVTRPIGPVTRIMRRHAIGPAGEHDGRAGKGAAAQCEEVNAKVLLLGLLPAARSVRHRPWQMQE